MTFEEREHLKVDKISIKDKAELRLAGGYERIYPLPPDKPNPELQRTYDHLIACSKEVWGEQMQGGGVCAKRRIEEIERQSKRATSMAQQKTQTVSMHHQLIKSPRAVEVVMQPAPTTDRH